MQNKGAIRLVAILLAIACAYQLSFTFVTRNVEKKANEYAAGDQQKAQAYIDSLKSIPVYNLGFTSFTYKECKEREINLGLDLKGGMNVMLEISVSDVVKALSNDSKDPIFIQAMAAAEQSMNNSSDDFITLFQREYESRSNGGRLSAIFNTPELRELVSANSTNQEVITVLREQTEGAISNSFNVLRNRIDRFGVTQPNIQRLEKAGRILVELPGVKEPERVRKLLQGTASLEFWATYDNSEIYPKLVAVNTIISDIEKAKATAVQNEVAGAQTEQTETIEVAQESAEGDDLIAQVSSTTAQASEAELLAQFPLFARLSPNSNPQTGTVNAGAVVGYALESDTAAVNAYFAMPQVKAELPRDLQLLWGVKAINDAENLFELFAIKANTRDGKAPLDGSAIVEARADYAEQGSVGEVSMAMDATGSRTWARLTADNVGSCIAIVLDGYVYSAPRVNGEITGGRSQITGNFTITEANDLANVLKSGKLPAPARIIQDTVVGPSLGQESINAGMMSFILAFVLVLIYMWIYYNTAGLVANVALIANLFFLFGVLVSFGAVLTLPGIAGIVLTMGMAVDANVIIYERIKEELRGGKGLGLAISDGFKHAYSAIIDGNATTLITGIVLFMFGSGPVQGFATTLIIGIITSLFCSIFITRLIFVSLLEKNVMVKFSTKLTENVFKNAKFNFIDARKKTYILSGALILISLVSLMTRGLNYGVDFSGGRAFVVLFDKDVDATTVREALDVEFASLPDEGNNSYEVKQFGSEGRMRIVTQYKFEDQSEDVTPEIEGILYSALEPLFVNRLSLTEFTNSNLSEYGIQSSDKVGPSVAHDIKVNSFIAVLFSLLAIGIYIAIRFRRWQWALGGVTALFHDAFITIGLFSVCYSFMPFAMEIDQAFIAAILTIIGYSINDTVVIFDRIREYQIDYPKRSMKENINNAINSTLARTLNTAGTTLVVLLAIFIFGGEVISGFVFALMFGVIIGTFSSVFVATPVAYDLLVKKEQQKGKK
ncbi:MAG: protein translocase subunit SecDF [Rikenellaceae bacterium]